MPLTKTAFKGARFQLITGIIADPAVGSSVNWPVPAGSVIEIQSVLFTLDTDATAVNRVACVSCYAGGVIFHQSAAPVPQMESLTRSYSFTVGILPIDYGSDTEFIYSNLACCMFLQPTEEFRIVVSNIQATDQISDIEIRYFQWKED